MKYHVQETTTGRLAALETDTRALRRATFPTTLTHVRSFIGMCNVFRWFVANFSLVARPLTELVGATALVQVPQPTAAKEHAFQGLYRLLVSPQILALPPARSKYALDVDACDSQVGGTLLQEQEDGSLHPVVYLSRPLNNRE